MSLLNNYDSIFDIISKDDKTLIIEGDNEIRTGLLKMIKEEFEDENYHLDFLFSVYKNIDKLKMIKEQKIDNIIIQTVGGNGDGYFEYAKEMFLKLDYQPKNLFLVFDDSKELFEDIFKVFPNMNVWSYSGCSVRKL